MENVTFTYKGEANIQASEILYSEEAYSLGGFLGEVAAQATFDALVAAGIVDQTTRNVSVREIITWREADLDLAHQSLKEADAAFISDHVIKTLDDEFRRIYGAVLLDCFGAHYQMLHGHKED